MPTSSAVTQLTVELNMELTTAQQNVFSARLNVLQESEGQERTMYYTMDRGYVSETGVNLPVGSYEFTDADTIVVTLNTATKIASIEIIH